MSIDPRVAEIILAWQGHEILCRMMAIFDDFPTVRRAELQCAFDIALSLQPPDLPEPRAADLSEIVADHSAYYTAPTSPCRCKCKSENECTMPTETHVATPRGACCPKLRWLCDE